MVIINFIILSGCDGCEDMIKDIKNYPQCKTNPEPPECHIFYTKSRQQCENTYGEKAPAICPQWFANDRNECLTKIPEEMREKYCKKFMTDTPENCKKYFPEDFERKCPKFFLKTAEECKRMLPDTYLSDPHCAAMVLTSKKICLEEFMNVCFAIDHVPCYYQFIRNYKDCVTIYEKCGRQVYYCRYMVGFVESKEDVIKKFGDDGKYIFPEFFTNTREECIEAFGDEAKKFCPKFFTFFYLFKRYMYGNIQGGGEI